MENKKLSELIKNVSLQKIIHMYYDEKIDLTSRQLSRIIKLKQKEIEKCWKGKTTV